MIYIYSCKNIICYPYRATYNIFSYESFLKLTFPNFANTKCIRTPNCLFLKVLKMDRKRPDTVIVLSRFSHYDCHSILKLIDTYYIYVTEYLVRIVYE